MIPHKLWSPPAVAAAIFLACSPACGQQSEDRSCLITGMYSSTIGSQDMRSSIRLPDSIRTYSHYLRRAGYYCTNNSKTDYNFATPKDAWDACSAKGHWRNRTTGQPFFAVFNYTGTHESQYRLSPERWRQRIARLTPQQRHDPDLAPVPPFHPDTPEVRRDWANYYGNLGRVDAMLPILAKELQDPTPYVRLRTMSVLDRLGDQARLVLPAIQAASMEKAPYPGEYLNRMVQYVSARLAQ